ncbi:hypothetical protein BH23VER1_BH23VER1_04830 [soil metagenome]
MPPVRRACFWVSLALAPLTASATPEAIRSHAARLPEVAAPAIAALAESHRDAPLATAYEDAWWYLTFYRWCELDRAAAGAFAQSCEDAQILRALLVAAHDLDPESSRIFAGSLGEDSRSMYANLFDPAKGEDDANPAEDVEPVVPLSDDEIMSGVADAFEKRSDEDRISALNSMLRPLVEADPDGTLHQIEALDTNPEQRRLLLEAVTGLLRRGDPAVFARLFDRLPTGQTRSQAAADAAIRWAKDDPVGAQAWADRLPAGPERDAALAATAAGRAENEPLAVLDLLDEHGWRMDFRTASQFRRTFTPGNFGGGSSGGWGAGSMQYAIRDALAHLVTEGKPQDAMARIAQIHDGDARQWVMGETVKAWVEEDAYAAIEWLAGAPEERALRGWFVQGLNKIASDGSPSAAAELVGQISDANIRNDVVRDIVRKGSGPAGGDLTSALLSWAGSLPDSTRSATEMAIVQGLTNSDPAAAASLLTSLSPADSPDNAWSNLGRTWAGDDAAAAGAYFREHAGQIPGSAFAQLTSEWVGSAPEAASTWVAGLHPGPHRDAAVAALVDHLSRGQDAGADFEAAVLWAGEIADPAIREQKLDALAAALQQTNTIPGSTSP